MEIGKMSKRISIPDTDLSLCPIGLGTAEAGVRWLDIGADRMFDTYLDFGGNVIDTARVYSDWVPPERGRSERVIGDWLKKCGKRNQIVLITKGGHPKFTSPDDDLHLSRMTPKDMRHDIELSLKTLGVETIDIYFYHRDDKSQTVEELLETMEEFRREGKIRYYGCSNWASERILPADAYSRSKGYRGFVADEALLNIGVEYGKSLPDDTLTSIAGDIFRYHERYPRNLAVAYMSVATGFFHRYLAKGVEAVLESPYYTPKNAEVAERVGKLAKKYNASVSKVLLGYLWQQPFQCVALYGPKNLDQLIDAMGAIDLNFEKADFAI
jgi:aryl-alcohol dehydrogenase-like predicted oxidoreductase